MVYIRKITDFGAMAYANIRPFGGMVVLRLRLNH